MAVWLYNKTRICNKIKFHALSSVAVLRNKMKKSTCYWKEWEWKSYKCIYMYNYLIYYERITRPNKPIDSFPSIMFIEYKRPEYILFLSFSLILFWVKKKNTRIQFNSQRNISMNILWKSSTTFAASVAFFSFFFSWKYSLPLFILFFLSFILFNPLVDKFVYISLYAKDEEKKKIDNKIIVFFSMVNQPKNVFSIKVLFFPMGFLLSLTA